MLNLIIAACAFGTIAVLLVLASLVVQENRRSERFDRAGEDYLSRHRFL